MVHRTSHGTLPHGRVVHQTGDEVKWTGEVIRNTDAIFYAMRATKPRRGRSLRVFVNSLSDVFHEQAITEGLTTEVYLLGRRWPTPFLVAPMALQQLAHPDAEVGMALAAAAQGVGLVLSMQASLPPSNRAGELPGAILSAK